MPSEITHKTGFSIGKYLGWLAVMFVFGFVAGINYHASAEKPTTPEPSRTVQTVPYP